MDVDIKCEQDVPNVYIWRIGLFLAIKKRTIQKIIKLVC